MRKVFFPVIALLISGASFAQQGQSGTQNQQTNSAPAAQNQQQRIVNDKTRMSPQEKGHEAAEGIAKVIALDGTQFKKIEQIEVQYYMNRHELMPMKKDNPEGFKEKMRTFTHDRETSIKAVLTKDQLAKYDAYKAEMKAKRASNPNAPKQEGEEHEESK